MHLVDPARTHTHTHTHTHTLTHLPSPTRPVRYFALYGRPRYPSEAGLYHETGVCAAGERGGGVKCEGVAERGESSVASPGPSS